MVKGEAGNGTAMVGRTFKSGLDEMIGIYAPDQCRFFNPIILSTSTEIEVRNEASIGLVGLPSCWR
jgi:hypothetical protein